MARAWELPVGDEVTVSGATSGPFSLFVRDHRIQPSHEVGAVEFDGAPRPFVVQGRSVTQWLGELAVRGLADQRVLAELNEGGDPNAGQPSGPALVLEVGAFYCDAPELSVCKISLALGASTATEPAWRWTESFPFTPRNQMTAEIILDALGRSVRLGVSRAVLPSSMQPPALAPVINRAPVLEPVRTTALFSEDMELRGPPVHDDCYDERGYREARQRERVRLEILLESDPRYAWKQLRAFGRPGARAIAQWLGAGAHGVSAAHIEDAATWVLECGPADSWRTGLMFYSWESNTREILHGVRGRAPVFGAEQAFWFVEHTTGKARREAALALVGGYKQRNISWNPFTGLTIHVEDVEAIAGVTPAHHVDAVVALLNATPEEGLWRVVVKSIGVFYSAEIPGQEQWGRLLIKALRETPADWEALHQDAALQAARGLTLELDEAVDLVITGGSPDVHTIMVAGLEDRMQRSGPEEAIRGPLQRFAKEGLGSSKGEAAGLLRRLERALD